MPRTSFDPSARKRTQSGSFRMADPFEIGIFLVKRLPGLLEVGEPWRWIERSGERRLNNEQGCGESGADSPELHR